MVKIKQFNSLSFIFLCCFARFLPILKQNARIIAVKNIVNKSTAVLRLNLEIPEYSKKLGKIKVWACLLKLGK